jgi:hypothetical protein
MAYIQFDSSHSRLVTELKVCLYVRTTTRTSTLGTGTNMPSMKMKTLNGMQMLKTMRLLKRIRPSKKGEGPKENADIEVDGGAKN